VYIGLSVNKELDQPSGMSVVPQCGF